MRWGVVFAVILAFLLACTPAKEPIIAEPIQEQAEPEMQEETITVEPPEAVEEPEIAEPEIPVPEEEEFYERAPDLPTIAKFLETYKNNVQDYKFIYKGDTWNVKGDKAKMIPFRVLQNEYHAPFIDTIYLDLQRRTAVGVCEGHNTNIKKQCALRNVMGQKYALPYVQFKIPLPHDWLMEFQNLYVTESQVPQLVLPRETVHLKHATSLRNTDLFIDPSIGLPVVVIDDSKEYHYDNLAKNQLGVTDSVTIQ